MRRFLYIDKIGEANLFYRGLPRAILFFIYQFNDSVTENDHETDLPAEQQEKKKQTWLSRTDEDKKWASGAGIASGEGSLEAHRER